VTLDLSNEGRYEIEGVFQKRVLRRIFGTKREDATEGWRKLHIKELYNVYSSHNIINMMKSRRVRWGM
jgi:hypothetical protein